MSNRSEKRNRKEEQKKLIVRVVCIVLALLMGLSAFVSLFDFFG